MYLQSQTDCIFKTILLKRIFEVCQNEQTIKPNNIKWSISHSQYKLKESFLYDSSYITQLNTNIHFFFLFLLLMTAHLSYFYRQEMQLFWVLEVFQ